MKNKQEELGIHIPDILLPVESIDMGKWAVVACDQYTSQPEYWHDVASYVKDTPSTYHLTLPEIYLEDKDVDERVQKINQTMAQYLSEGFFNSHNSCMIYVERTTEHTGTRKGLVLSVDLEKYDYNKGSQSLIRATEGTVIERLPPRMKIRKNAAIELPHIMLLIDDPQRSIIEPITAQINHLSKLYAFELMKDGGQITGYKIDNEPMVSNILKAFETLANPDVFSKKYNVDKDTSVLLFAVGDGNHSLAAAKGHWENVKKCLPKEEIASHPSRYALVEVVNIHDEGLQFEPIHRVVFNVNTTQMPEDLLATCPASSKIVMFDSKEEMLDAAKEYQKNKNHHVLPFVTKDTQGIIVVNEPKFNLEVATLQTMLDVYAKNNAAMKIDYIHGADVVDTLCEEENTLGFYLPVLDKFDFFRTIIIDGTLPRKTFSMGEAEEKRFYVESRKIVK